MMMALDLRLLCVCYYPILDFIYSFYAVIIVIVIVPPVFILSME